MDDLDIIGVIPGACDREIYMKPNKLWKYLMDLTNNRHKYIKRYTRYIGEHLINTIREIANS